MRSAGVKYLAVAVLICLAGTPLAFAQADVSVELTGGSDGSGGPGPVEPSYTIKPGGYAVYGLTVRNQGPNTATGVIATVVFPPDTSIDTVSIGSGTASCASAIVSGNPTVTCTAASLAATGSFFVLIRLNLDADYPWQNGLFASASVTSAVADPVPSNNTATVNLYVAPPPGAAQAPILDVWSTALLIAILAIAAVIRAGR